MKILNRIQEQLEQDNNKSLLINKINKITEKYDVRNMSFNYMGNEVDLSNSFIKTISEHDNISEAVKDIKYNQFLNISTVDNKVTYTIYELR